MMSDIGTCPTDEASSSDPSDLEVGEDGRALLEQAALLTGITDPAELVRVALAELVERRRFQKWVDAHDSSRGCA